MIVNDSISEQGEKLKLNIERLNVSVSAGCFRKVLIKLSSITLNTEQLGTKLNDSKSITLTSKQIQKTNYLKRIKW